MKSIWKIQGVQNCHFCSFRGSEFCVWQNSVLKIAKKLQNLGSLPLKMSKWQFFALWRLISRKICLGKSRWSNLLQEKEIKFSLGLVDIGENNYFFFYVTYFFPSIWLTTGWECKKMSNAAAKQYTIRHCQIQSEYHIDTETQCGNFVIFSSLRFYVKSTLGILEVQKI